MKKTLLTLIVAALAIPALALPKLGAMRDFGEGLIPEAARGSIREVVQTAARHFLNFRQETPLSDEQRQKIVSIMETHRTEIHGLATRGRDARRACADSVKAQGSESSATREAAAKIGEVARDRALLMAKIGGEVRPLLTADQQKRLEAARDEIEGLVDEALNIAAK